MDYQESKIGAPEVLTDEMFTKAKKCLTASLSIMGTCRVLGIARSTWYLWKKKSEEVPLKKENQKYFEFFKMVHTALGDAELKLVLDIQADASWQSKHTILKRRFNNDWGEKQEVNINQNNVVKHDFSDLTDEQIEEQLERIRQKEEAENDS